MCSGLPQDLIDAIMKYDGAGIQFVCMKCQVQHVSARGDSPTSHTEPHLAETISHLYNQVKGICSALRELSNQVKALSSQQAKVSDHGAAVHARSQDTGPHIQTQTNPQQPSNNLNYRSMIREELKEQREREKRQSFIIVKGLAATSPSDFASKFTKLADDCMGLQVLTSEVFPITGHANFYRVRVNDDQSRKALLDKAKQLRGSQYERVYISRDLTYAQRTELFQRRQERRQQLAQADGPLNQGSDYALPAPKLLPQRPVTAAVPSAPPSAPMGAEN